MRKEWHDTCPCCYLPFGQQKGTTKLGDKAAHSLDNKNGHVVRNSISFEGDTLDLPSYDVLISDSDGSICMFACGHAMCYPCFMRLVGDRLGATKIGSVRCIVCRKQWTIDQVVMVPIHDTGGTTSTDLPSLARAVSKISTVARDDVTEGASEHATSHLIGEARRVHCDIVSNGSIAMELDGLISLPESVCAKLDAMARRILRLSPGGSNRLLAALQDATTVAVPHDKDSSRTPRDAREVTGDDISGCSHEAQKTPPSDASGRAAGITGSQGVLSLAGAEDNKPLLPQPPPPPEQSAAQALLRTHIPLCQQFEGKIVVFSEWTDVLLTLASLLQKCKVGYVVVAPNMDRDRACYLPLLDEEVFMCDSGDVQHKPHALRAALQHARQETRHTYSLSGSYVKGARGQSALARRTVQAAVRKVYARYRQYGLRPLLYWERYNTPEDRIRLFREHEHCDVMLANLSYSSHGLNLTEARHVMFVEAAQNPSTEAQAVGRVHRIGQWKTTFVHRFTIRDSIEERVLAIKDRAARRLRHVSTRLEMEETHSEKEGGEAGREGQDVTIDGDKDAYRLDTFQVSTDQQSLAIPLIDLYTLLTPSAKG